MSQIWEENGNQDSERPKYPKKEKSKDIHNKIHYSQTVKSQNKINFESNESQVKCHIQVNPHETIHRFFSRSLAGQKGTVRHTQSAGRKNDHILGEKMVT